ncbi:hypothetical protein Tco_0121360 [Tanacetum coccineum]
MNRLLSLFKTKPTRFKRYKNFFHELQGCYGYLFAHLRARFIPGKSFDTLADNLHDVMVETLPTMVDKHIKEQVMKQVSEEVHNQVPVTPVVRPRDQDDPHDDAHLGGSHCAKGRKTSEYETYLSGVVESIVWTSFSRGTSSSTSGYQSARCDFDFWTDSYASDDDEIPTKQVSQDIMEEVSLTIDEAKLRKMADEMLRQRCTLGDEHQYHIDSMQEFLMSDIAWRVGKRIFLSLHIPRMTSPFVQSCQNKILKLRLSLINQDLLYLKKGNFRPEKIVLLLHKFPAVIFNDDDIEEQTSRWVNKYVQKFNPYARYGVEHWKNPHAKIFYIRKQKEPGKPKERYNDIGKECMTSKLGIESLSTIKVNLTAPTMTFPGIEDHEICSGKGHYARNCPKPRVRDSKYFMEQMLLAKQDEAGVILTDEQNDFLRIKDGRN